MATKLIRIESGEQRQGYRAQMKAIDEPGEVIFPFSPESYRVRIAPRWAPRQIAGAEYDRLSWEGNSPRVISFEHILTVGDVWVRSLSGAVTEDRTKLTSIELLITTIETWARRITLATQRPTRVRLSMGVNEFQGVITSFDYTRLVQSAEGYALTAEIRFELSEEV